MKEEFIVLETINTDTIINKTENKILTYESVEISFGGRTVVQDVNFSLKSGEILGLVGESWGFLALTGLLQREISGIWDKIYLIYQKKRKEKSEVQKSV